MNRPLALIVGVLVVGVGLIAANWDYLYEELAVDPAGMKLLFERLENSRCKDAPDPVLDADWTYDTNLHHCYQIEKPIDWGITRNLSTGEWTIDSPANIDDAIAIDEDKDPALEAWRDLDYSHSVKIRVFDSLKAFAEMDRNYQGEQTVEQYLKRDPVVYEDVTEITLGEQPAWQTFGFDPYGPGHDLILSDYRGKITVIERGGIDSARFENERPIIDKMIQSFRFLPEFD